MSETKLLKKDYKWIKAMKLDRGRVFNLISLMVASSQWRGRRLGRFLRLVKVSEFNQENMKEMKNSLTSSPLELTAETH